NNVRIGTWLPGHMQIVAEQPVPHCDSDGKLDCGLSVDELNTKPRYIGIQREVSDAAPAQIDLEGRTRTMVGRGRVQFLPGPVVADQQPQISVRGGLSASAFPYAAGKTCADLQGVVERVDADGLQINLARRHDRVGGAKMLLAGQLRDSEVA